MWQPLFIFFSIFSLPYKELAQCQRVKTVRVLYMGLFYKHNSAIIEEMRDSVFFEDNLRISDVDNRIEIMVNTNSFDNQWIGTGAADVATKAITISRHTIMNDRFRVEILVSVYRFARCGLDDWGHG